MESANVVSFPDGAVVDLRPKPKWATRWWPNSTDAYMMTVFDSPDVACAAAAEKLKEGARKVEIEARTE